MQRFTNLIMAVAQWLLFIDYRAGNVQSAFISSLRNYDIASEYFLEMERAMNILLLTERINEWLELLKVNNSNLSCVFCSATSRTLSISFDLHSLHYTIISDVFIMFSLNIVRLFFCLKKFAQKPICHKLKLHIIRTSWITALCLQIILIYSRKKFTLTTLENGTHVKLLLTSSSL